MKVLIEILVFILISISTGLRPTEVRAASEASITSMSPEDTQNMNTDFGEIIDGESNSLVNLSYFGILYGPSVNHINSYQPNTQGLSDLNRPIIIKNFLSISHNLSPQISISGAAYWVWQPVLKQDVQIQDPFLKVAYNSVFHSNGWNLYADLRTHLAITSISRQNDLRLGLQPFQALTYEVPSTRLTLGLYASELVNFFGDHGYGDDLELYIAPNLNYQLSSTVTLTCLFEIQRGHWFGASPFPLYSMGTDIAPGISWDIAPQVTVNPYLNINTENKISLSSTSFGMMMSWILL